MSTERGPRHEHNSSYIPLLERTPDELQRMTPEQWAEAEFHAWGGRFDIPDADEATRELHAIATNTFPGTFVPVVVPDVASTNRDGWYLDMRWMLMDRTPLPRRMNESVPLPYTPIVPSAGVIKHVGPDPFEEVTKEQIKEGNVQKPKRGSLVPGCRYDMSPQEVEKILNACGAKMGVTQEPIRLPTPREMIAVGTRADWRIAVLGPAEGRLIWPTEMTMFRNAHITSGLVGTYDWRGERIIWGNRQDTNHLFTPFSPMNRMDGSEMEMNEVFAGYRPVVSNGRPPSEDNLLQDKVSWREGFSYQLRARDFDGYSKDLDEFRVGPCGGQPFERPKRRLRIFR